MATTDDNAVIATSADSSSTAPRTVGLEARPVPDPRRDDATSRVHRAVHAGPQQPHHDPGRRRVAVADERRQDAQHSHVGPGWAQIKSPSASPGSTRPINAISAITVTPGSSGRDLGGLRGRPGVAYRQRHHRDADLATGGRRRCGAPDVGSVLYADRTACDRRRARDARRLRRGQRLAQRRRRRHLAQHRCRPCPPPRCGP